MTTPPLSPHPQSEILIAIANGERIQALTDESGGMWFDTASPLGLIGDPKYKLRVKPDVIIVNKIEFKRPCQAPLPTGTKYYRVSLVDPKVPVDQWWNDTPRDKSALQYGMVHLERKEAVAHGLALVSFTRKKE